MRILSTILVFHILFLTVAPAIAITSASVEKKQCEKSCCSTPKETKQSNEQSGDCCNTACNPFMVCCNCNAVVSQKQTISAPVFLSDKKHFSIISKNGYDYIAKAWNPPKTV
jgi:hypothetical protein